MSTIENDPSKQIKSPAADQIRNLKRIAELESDFWRILKNGPDDRNDVSFMFTAVGFALCSLHNARADGTLPMPQPSTPA